MSMFFLARQDASTQQVRRSDTQMTGIVEQLGGKVVKMENGAYAPSPIG